MSLSLFALTTAVIVSLLALRIESSIIPSNDESNTKKYLRNSIVTIALFAVIYTMVNFIENRFLHYRPNDLQLAEGRYEQVVIGLEDRPYSEFRIFYDSKDRQYRIEGVAFDGKGNPIAFWTGVVTDNIANDRQVQWAGEGRILVSYNLTRTVENFGTMHLLPAANDNTFPGSFLDRSDQTFKQFAFLATKKIA